MVSGGVGVTQWLIVEQAASRTQPSPVLSQLAICLQLQRLIFSSPRVRINGSIADATRRRATCLRLRRRPEHVEQGDRGRA